MTTFTAIFTIVSILMMIYVVTITITNVIISFASIDTELWNISYRIYSFCLDLVSPIF